MSMQQGSGQSTEDGAYGSNPYYAQASQAAERDLEANAPTLRAEESRKVNQKALLFLGGIVLLLVFLGFALFRGMGGDEKEAEPKKEESVVVPELPRAQPQPAPAPVEPIALAAQEPPLPPLPLEREVHTIPQTQEPSPRESYGPTLMERRMLEQQAAQQGGQTAADQYLQALTANMNQQQGPAAQATAQPVMTSATPINRPNTLLVRGTYIRCILETRIVTDVPGYSSCIVTEPVYSINGRKLLIPKGSKVLGQYGQGAGDVHRVSVVWDRITTPNGINISMSSPGIDNLGGAGIPGHYNAHWGQRLSSALLISLVSDGFKYAAAKHGPESSTVGMGGTIVTEPYESATARTMERAANDALQENMRRPATVTVNQGTLINVYVTQDVDFGGVVQDS